MPSRFKKRIRERMTKTGERYAAAFAHVRSRAPRSLPRRELADACGNAEWIQARYFGRDVTFALVMVQGYPVLMIAPRASAGVAAAETRVAWRVLGEAGEH